MEQTDLPSLVNIHTKFTLFRQVSSKNHLILPKLTDRRSSPLIGRVIPTDRSDTPLETPTFNFPNSLLFGP